MGTGQTGRHGQPVMSHVRMEHNQGLEHALIPLQSTVEKTVMARLRNIKSVPMTSVQVCL